jgi:hypothetical protein
MEEQSSEPSPTSKEVIGGKDTRGDGLEEVV